MLLSAERWRELVQLRDGMGDDDPVFESRKGGCLSRVQVWNIVRKGASRADIERNISPHWMRHAHASHALDRGAPVHLIKDTLGHATLATTSQYSMRGRGIRVHVTFPFRIPPVSVTRS